MAEILKQEAVREIILCHKDPVYFIIKYCKIQHPTKGLVPFALYPYQKEALYNFLASDRVIVNKGRQLGFSTLTAAFIAWLILFNNNKSVLIVATKADVAKNMIKKIKVILAKLPKWMYLANVSENQAHKVGLSNGSWAKAVARSDDVGRSEALSLLVIDEAAHIRGMDEIWKGLSSTVATGGKVLAVSTPKGLGNWFYRYCKEAQEEINGFKYLEYPWYVNPEYAQGMVDDPEVPGGKSSPWFQNFTAGWTIQEIWQELLTSFLESGDTYIRAETIEKYRKLTMEPIEKKGLDRNLWIWKKPQKYHRYLIPADTALGTGLDFSSFAVIDAQDVEVVAEYKGKMPPDQFALFLVEVGTEYNGAMIIPENQGIGMATAITLKNTDYKNVAFFDQDTMRLLDKWLAEVKGISPGVPMSSKIRPVILAKLQEFLDNGYLKSYSIRLIKELETFAVENGKPQAMKNHHDDIIMALAIGVWIREICPDFKYSTVASGAKNMYNSVKVTTNSADFSSPAQARQRIQEIVAKQNAFISPDGRVIDMSWIVKR